MNLRNFLIWSLLLFLFGTNVYAGGAYQRTKDREALVWNERPRAGQVVTWSGKRDDDEYATGRGTVVWYKTVQRVQTGTHIPNTKEIAVNSYTGRMIKGKLSGMVTNVNAKGKAFHARFVKGKRMGRWVAGPAPGPSGTATAEVRPAEPVSSPPPFERVSIALDQKPAGAPSPQEAVVELPAEGPVEAPKLAIASPSVAGSEIKEEPLLPKVAAVEPPAEGPALKEQDTQRSTFNAQRPRAEPLAEGPALKEQDVQRSTAEPPPKTSREDIDDSVKSLISPPPGLRMKDRQEKSAAPVSATTVRPRLTVTEVIKLADAEARTHGYNLDQYQRPQAQFTTVDDSWSVTYDGKPDPNGMSDSGKQFSVRVEDATKKASLSR